MDSDCFAVVIGGGFFGSNIACHLQRRYGRVVLIERESELLTRASFANQARVHQGYHYPRSLITALRSRESYRRFTLDYADCLDRSFRHYYAVARNYSKVNATYFEQFARRIAAPLSEPPAGARDLFASSTIEQAYLVEECAFDANRLRERLQSELRAAQVEVRTSAEAVRVEPAGAGLTVHCAGADGNFALRTRQVFNCSFAGINALMRASGLKPLPMKYELAELALVEAPAELTNTGITVMCGPFFSCMPFPALGLHSLSHVRYTPHLTWFDDAATAASSHEDARRRPPPTHYPQMVRDAARYVPALSRCRYQGSLWEVKAILRSSESNDSRPILFARDVGLPNLHCVLGAKIDNVYDVLSEIDQFLLAPGMAA